MDETTKAVVRRMHSPGFATRYFVGNGIDIGAGKDGLDAYKHLFPLILSCRSWDILEGDAQAMAGVENETFDFVHSSHCLEHLRDPIIALHNWLRILKPGGYMVVLVPDEDLYEQGHWPSRFNSDHKWRFTLQKFEPSEHTLCITELLDKFAPWIEPIKIELLCNTYNYNLKGIDQTYGVAESAIEFILRKK